MNFIAIFRIALNSLKRNKTRTSLTMLGIIIGVAAVIAMLAIGQGAQKIVEDQVKSMGTNLITISSNFSSSRTSVRQEQGFGDLIKLEDVEAIRDNVNGILYISPVVRSGGQIKYGSSNWRASVQGVDTDFFSIRDFQISEGNIFNVSEVRSGAKVCVLGQTVVTNLFPNESPIGKTIRIRNIPMKVLGVLKPKGESVMGFDQDDTVIAPYTTVLTRFMGDHRPPLMINVSAESKEQMPKIQQDIKDLLRLRHPMTTEDDFFVRTQTDVAETSETISNTLTLLLASIAGISLLVGGIGIMNIMLVSVTERIREIGIRMAVGANKRDVLLQFLIEAMVISFLGGIVGIALGMSAAYLIGGAMKWSISISLWSVLLSVGFSCLIGIFFGWYPAKKAANLNLIDALRYE